MNRLTEEKQIGPWASLKNKAEAKVGAFNDYECLMAHMEAVTRLKYYEDLEEQGRLVVLPCKAGDMVHSIEPRFYNYAKHEGVQRGFCEKFEMDKKGRCCAWVRLEYGEPSTMYAYNVSNFGKTVFLTREEAEAALKEKEG